MSLNIDYPCSSGYEIGFSIMQLSSRLLFDFSSNTFSATPATTVQPLAEGKGLFLGLYSGGISGVLPPVFTNGNYRIAIHFIDPPMTVFDSFTKTIYGGDDGPVFPGPYAVTSTMIPIGTPAPTSPATSASH
jgi:hypothetical protein